MTLPERLYARPADIHPSPLRATARNAGVRFNSDDGLQQRAFDAAKPAPILLRKQNSLPPSPVRSGLADPRRPSCRSLKSHSQITASVTPATHSKRPYRNRPGRENCAESRLNHRGGPDRDLSFMEQTGPRKAGEWAESGPGSRGTPSRRRSAGRSRRPQTASPCCSPRPPGR